MHTAEFVSMLVFVLVFLATAGGGRALLLQLYGDHRRALARLQDLSLAPETKVRPEHKPSSLRSVILSALPRVGTLVAPNEGERRARLKARMTQAGIYGPNAVSILLGVQVLLTVLLPATAGLVPLALGLLPWWY